MPRKKKREPLRGFISGTKVYSTQSRLEYAIEQTTKDMMATGMTRKESEAMAREVIPLLIDSGIMNVIGD